MHHRWGPIGARVGVQGLGPPESVRLTRRLFGLVTGQSSLLRTEHPVLSCKGPSQASPQRQGRGRVPLRPGPQDGAPAPSPTGCVRPASGFSFLSLSALPSVGCEV